MTSDRPALLAVDLGLRSGYAYFTRAGRLSAYRSQNHGSAARLKKAIPHLLEPVLTHLAIEGGGPLADAWMREAEKRNLTVHRFGAEKWRETLLYPRTQRTGEQAKQTAALLARQVIAWSGLKRPTSLRHDAAEAILIGLYVVNDLGWLDPLPDEMRPPG